MPIDFQAEGFDRVWIQRESKVVPPRDYRKIFQIAHWLQVPAEYIVGFAPEYANMAAWEVATRASLELFFRQHPEGREAARCREDCEQQIAAATTEAPKTIAAWAVWFDGFQRGRARGRAETRRLEGSVSGDPGSA